MIEMARVEGRAQSTWAVVGLDRTDRRWDWRGVKQSPSQALRKQECRGATKPSELIRHPHDTRSKTYCSLLDRGFIGPIPRDGGECSISPRERSHSQGCS